MMRSFRIFIIFTLVLLLFPGGILADYCTVTDIVGNTVNISSNISRVVTVDPFTCQFIYIIGAEDKLVGTDIGPSNMSLMKIFQPSIAYLPNPGGKNKVNITKLQNLNPDLVIADKTYNETIKKVSEIGIPVVQIDVESPESLIKSYEIIGKALGKEKETADFVSYYIQKMNLIQNNTAFIKENDKKKIYFAQTDLYHTLGDGYYESGIANIAGGKNAAEGYSKGDNKISIDEIYKWNPDLVILFSYNSVKINDSFTDQKLQSLPALRSKNIFQMPKYLMCWELPVPESILGTMWLQNLMYPKKTTYNLTNEIKEFYNKFYHINLTNSDINQILNDHSRTTHLFNK
jgi:iron complex transport system substrate-binding protein